MAIVDNLNVHMRRFLKFNLKNKKNLSKPFQLPFSYLWNIILPSIITGSKYI